MSSSQDGLVDGSSTPKPEQQTATDGIASNDAEQVKDEEMKAVEPEQFEILVMLPTPPAPELAAAKSTLPSDKGALALTITTSAAEPLRELKTIVLEGEGYWLGAFSFVRVPAESADGTPVSDDLEGTKEPLHEWLEIGTIFQGQEYKDLSVPRILKVVDCSWTEAAAREHLLRARDVFTNSFQGTRLRQTYRIPAMEPNSPVVEAGTTMFSTLRGPVKFEEPIFHRAPTSSTEDAQTESSTKSSKKGKKSKARTNGIEKPESASPPNDSAAEEQEHAFANWPQDRASSSLAAMIASRKLIVDKPPVPLCVKQLTLSPWNPPTQQQRLRGHLLYISITTLEGDFLHITVTTAGMYVDKSDNYHFDPTPRQARSSPTAERTFSSIFSLLGALSPRFLKSMATLLKPEVPLHPDTFSNALITNCMPAAPWLVSSPPPMSDFIRSQAAYLLTGSMTLESLPTARDWNADFVLIRDLPKSTMPERLARERFLSRTLADLAYTAGRSVVGIVHGDILPANPPEPPQNQTIFHQNLLFVPAADALDGYAHLGGDEAVHVQTAKDVNGIKIMNQLDLDKIHLCPTIVVDYLGERWIAQTILPGFTSFQDSILPPTVAAADKEKVNKEKESEKKAEDLSESTASLNSFHVVNKEEGESAASSPVLAQAEEKDAEKKETKAEEATTPFKIVYGSADTEITEGRYAAEPEVVELAKKIGQALRLAPHKVKDANGKETELELSGDTKIIRGLDGNHYLIDLFRLQPVDVCFLEDDIDGTSLYLNPSETAAEEELSSIKYPHRFVLLRPELIEAFHESRLRTWIYERINETSEVKKESEAAKSNALANRREGETEEQATKRAEIEAIVETLQQPRTVIDITQFDLTFNPDAFVERKNEAAYVKSDESDPTVKSVRDASHHLRSSAIASLISDIINVGMALADGTSVTRQFHSHGINMRYLGLVASRASVEQVEVPEKHREYATCILQALVRSLEREMLVRAAKHVLRRLLKGRDLSEIAPCISHFFNCLLGTSLNPHPAPDTSTIPPTTRDRVWTKLSPDSLRSDLRKEVASRYRYCLPASYFDRLPKEQLLRDICLRVGIQLELRDYDLQTPVTNGITSTEEKPSSSKAKKTSEPVTRSRTTTFDPSDVVQVYPIVKEVPHKSTLADEVFEQGNRHVSQGNLAIGEGLVTDALAYYEQIFGQVHPELAVKYHELAVLYHQVAQPIARNVNTYENGHTAESTSEEQEKAKRESGLRDDDSLAVAKRETAQFWESAVQMNRQSVILAERTMGLDHPITAQQYIDLGILEHASGNAALGLKMLRHAFELFSNIYGEGHPEAIRALTNAAQILTQWKGHAAAVPLLATATELSSQTRGSTSIATGTIMVQLANAQALSGDLITSRETAGQASELFNLRLGKFDEKTVEAANLHEVLTKAILNKERGEQAKVGRLARRLGLNEERAKQLMAKGAKEPTVAKTTEDSAAIAVQQLVAPSMGHLPLDELVSFIQGQQQGGVGSSKKQKAKR